MGRPGTKLIIEIALFFLSEIGSGWIIPAKHPEADPPPYPGDSIAWLFQNAPDGNLVRACQINIFNLKPLKMYA